MVEVFRTNVENLSEAILLIGQIHSTFCDYTANFDLEDCDRILRVEHINGSIRSQAIIDLIRDFGFHAEVLPDDNPVLSNRMEMFQMININDN